MTRFIMIRHGFSVANNEHRFAGNSDIPLTDLGKAQAERCAEALKDERIDAIYASDLSRAFDTARPVARTHGLEITATKALREIFAGKWEGKSFDQIDEEYHDEFALWKRDIGRARCTGGESPVDVSARVLAALSEIAERHEGKTVCIATHATPIRSVCTAAAGLDASDMAMIPWTANASISLFEYEDGIFTAVYTSNTDHLGDLRTAPPTNV